MRGNNMLDLIKSKWTDILNYIKTEYEISDVSFDTWLKPLNVYAVDNGVVTIVVDDANGVNYINKRFYKCFRVAIDEFFGEDLDVQFIAPEDTKNYSPESPEMENNEVYSSESELNKRLLEANLNPKYTFDTFVVGGSNNFAHAYALKVAEAPAEICNPLFLYGGVGLGKTHLMQSIAHYIIEHNAKSKVLYVTSETFINELISSIRNGNQQEVNNFRDKYRNIDVLLIDDIQFIIGKDRGQEEFFHTFNALYESNKQIVISSDKPPKEMTTLEERLRSRFGLGLSVDISSPEYETRMAILQKRAENEEYNIDDDILKYIATNIVSNIRELEGALTKVVAYSKISPVKLDLELAKEILKDSISPDSHKEITSKLIIQVVTDYFNISITDIASKKKSQDIVIPRQICMYLCRSMTDDTLYHIGELLGNLHHTTIMHGYDKIDDAINTNEKLRDDIEKIKKRIKQG